MLFTAYTVASLCNALSRTTRAHSKATARSGISPVPAESSDYRPVFKRSGTRIDIVRVLSKPDFQKALTDMKVRPSLRSNYVVESSLPAWGALPLLWCPVKQRPHRASEHANCLIY
jgi:hypothetical protein